MPLVDGGGLTGCVHGVGDAVGVFGDAHESVLESEGRGLECGVLDGDGHDDSAGVVVDHQLASVGELDPFAVIVEQECSVDLRVGGDPDLVEVRILDGDVGLGSELHVEVEIVSHVLDGDLPVDDIILDREVGCIDGSIVSGRVLDDELQGLCGDIAVIIRDPQVLRVEVDVVALVGDVPDPSLEAFYVYYGVMVIIDCRFDALSVGGESLGEGRVSGYGEAGDADFGVLHLIVVATEVAGHVDPQFAVGRLEIVDDEGCDVDRKGSLERDLGESGLDVTVGDGGVQTLDLGGDAHVGSVGHVRGCGADTCSDVDDGVLAGCDVGFDLGFDVGQLDASLEGLAVEHRIGDDGDGSDGIRRVLSADSVDGDRDVIGLYVADGELAFELHIGDLGFDGSSFARC